ncbi:hypothetical protein Golomagni_06961, partial [Golovinomyces magnicellulatus]
MDDLLNLELLSLVSKVTSELQNHVGVNDKTLAEFIIAQRVDSPTADAFRTKLEGMGAGFPESLVDSIDRLVSTMHPKLKGKKNNDASEQRPGRSLQEKEKMFGGLSLADKPVDAEPEADAIDDTLALLEGLESKARKDKPTRARSRSPRQEQSESKRRRRDRSRSREHRKRDRH